MKTSCYLIVDKDGNITFRKSQYTIKTGQIPIKINIEIPDTAFKELIFEGTLKISEEQFDSTIKELEIRLQELRENE